MATVLGSLLVKLGLDSAHFNAGLSAADRRTRQSGDRMEDLGRKVGGAAKALIGLGAAIAGSQLVGQIKDMALAGLDHASALGEQAQQLGVNTSELQRYRFIATQVGIDQAVMDKGLAKLSITLGDLANGAKAPTKALEQLGFSQEEIARIAKLTAGEAIPVLADAFAKLKSPTEAAAVAADLFGAKMGGKFLPLLMGGKAGIDALTESYKKLGIEISEGQIARADEAMDKMAALQEVAKARQAQVAADNAEGILAGLQAWEEFKAKAIVIFGELIQASNRFDAEIKRIGDAIPDPLTKIGEAIDWVDETYASARQGIIDSVKQIGQSIAQLATGTLATLSRMVEGIKDWLGNKLAAAWDAALAKIRAVKAAFFDLADAVVFNSYIPDMVDGIAAHMSRLGAVMVDPAKSATERTKQLFEKLGEDVARIMDKLFPDARELATFRDELKALDQGIAAGGAGGFNADQLRAARERLIAGASADARAGTALPLADQLGLFGNDSPFTTDAIRAELAKLSAAANDNTRDIEVANVRIVKSFKDMALETLSAIRGLSDAIKGGGFFDILDAVVKLGMQLGSIGAFGGDIQSSINASASVPGFAGGTSFAPGGLALVGERGAELVNLPRGSQVVPNHELGGLGGGNVYNISGNLLTPEWWSQIQAMDERAARAGGELGLQRVAYRQSRQVG